MPKRTSSQRTQKRPKLKAELLDVLVDGALKVLHHDGNRETVEVKAEIAWLKEEFSKVLDPLLNELRKLNRKIARLESQAAESRL